MQPLDPRDHLKHFLLTQEEFDALPEYSLSKPTGVTNGMLWKAHRQASPNGRWMECWIVCEYKIVGNLTVTYFYKPIIMTPMPDVPRRGWYEDLIKKFEQNVVGAFGIKVKETMMINFGVMSDMDLDSYVRRCGYIPVGSGLWTESVDAILIELIPFHWAVSLRRLRGGNEPDIWRCLLQIGSVEVRVENKNPARALVEAYCVAVEAGAKID